MARENKNLLNKIACTAITTVMLCGTAYGATLQIKNDDTAEVDITALLQIFRS